MSIIPFYGAQDRAMFAIERAAMDRPGRVIEHLDSAMPAGCLLDIGAGDGFTADRLTRSDRMIFGLEPAAEMMNRDRNLIYMRGSAEALPFPDNVFDGAYATWAYFFPRFFDISQGLAEMRRVVRPGGPMLIVDNLGGDEFSRWLGQAPGVDRRFWEDAGFHLAEIDTVFEFSHKADAETLMSFFAGRTLTAVPKVIEYRVAVMSSIA